MKKIGYILFVFAFLQQGHAQPTGYYSSAEGLFGEDLKAELHSIIDNHTAITYDKIWTAIEDTDLKEDGTVWDMYSDNPAGPEPYVYNYGTDQCGNYSGEGSCYNREHSFPGSWFNDASPMNTDLFHIYPTDGYVNGQRGNYPYGNVESASWVSENGSKKGNCAHADYSGTVFEPIDEYKGDFARSYFYMLTRYYGDVNAWSSPMLDNEGFADWALETLLDWHKQDPVSAKETERNKAVYNYQGNRNPFIDNPEYVQSIWSSERPEPSNHAADFRVAEAVELAWEPQGEHATHYLVMKNTTGCNEFSLPEDGQAYPDNAGRINLEAAETSHTWFVDPAEPTYYFIIVPYNEANHDYKTDGNVPCAEVTVE